MPNPPSLNYSSPAPPDQPPRRLFRQFLAGLAVGVVISLLAWVAGWNTIDKTNYGFLMFWFVIGFKCIGGIAGLCFRRWRMPALGLIVSLPIGAMIFFTSCAAHLNMH